MVLQLTEKSFTKIKKAVYGKIFRKPFSKSVRLSVSALFLSCPTPAEPTPATPAFALSLCSLSLAQQTIPPLEISHIENAIEARAKARMADEARR